MVRIPPHKLQRGGMRPTATRGRTASASMPSLSAAAAQTSASTSSRASVVYWKLCGESAPLYYGPLGDVIGEVLCGTVVRELRRYMDPFGSWWIAVKGMDGDVVWALLSREDSTEDGDDATTTGWQRVYDARVLCHEGSSSERDNEEVITSLLRPSVIPMEVNPKLGPSKDVLLHDIHLLEECWRNISSSQNNKGRDWNAEYQQLVDMVLFERWEKSVSASDKMRTFMGEFSKAAEEAALTAITDMLRPSSDRVAKGPILDTAGSFIHNTLFVNLVIDDGGSGGVFKGDEHAWRVASQSLQAMRLMALEGPKRLLYSPPSAVVTFSGFRCFVMAIPPIEVKNIVYISSHEREDTLDAPEIVKTQLMDLGTSLGLKQHSIKLSTGGDVASTRMPLGLTVVAGNDKRLYVMNTSRLFPPCVTLKGDGLDTNEALSLRFRPEFLFSYGKPLSSDSFVKDAATPEDNNDIMEAMKWMRDELILSVASMLGFHQAVEFPRQDPAECKLCPRIMENELRFVVCRSVDMCCCICSHCFTQRLTEGEKDPSLFSDAVKCDSSARGPRGLLLQPSVTSIFHAAGLNMRFLPFVYYRIPHVARFVVGHYCEVEMIARTAVRLLRDKLRRTAQSVDEVKAVCQEFLLGLLQSSGAKAKRFWAEELGPALESFYGVQGAFDTSMMDAEFLYHRVAELSGVRLHTASVASFHSERPYLQLASVEMLIKTVQPPLLLDETFHEKSRSLLLQYLEDILLFWIGFSTKDDCDKENEYLEPFYLSERETWM